MSPLDDNALDALERQLQDVQAELEAVENAVRDKKMRAEDLLARIEQSMEQAIGDEVRRLKNVIVQVQSRNQAIGAIAKDVPQKVEQARDECNASLSDVATALSDRFELVSETLTGVEQRLAERRANFVSACTETLDEFLTADVAEMTADITAGVTGFADDLSEKAEEILLAATHSADKEITRQPASEDLAAPVVAALEASIDDLFEKARTELVEQSEEASAKREAMEALRHQVKPAFEALEDALDHVRAVARSVGISL